MSSPAALKLNSSIPLDQQIRFFGTNWSIYSATLYGLTPAGGLSAVFNFIAYCILMKKEFKSSTIFKYLRINVMNSLIISLLVMTRFTFIIYKFDYTNTYEAITYGNYIFAPFLSIFYLNGNLLDIYIILERILTIKPQNIVKKVIKFEYFWLFMFLFSLIINLPLFFITIPGCVDVKYGSTILKNYFNRQTEFSSSNLGKITTSIVYFIRDILTLAAKINVVSGVAEKSRGT